MGISLLHPGLKGLAAEPIPFRTLFLYNSNGFPNNAMDPLKVAALPFKGRKKISHLHFQIGRLDGGNGFDAPLLEKMAAEEVKLVPGG